MTWTLDTLNLDLAGASQLAEQISGEAPVTATLMQAMIAFNYAVENSPVATTAHDGEDPLPQDRARSRRSYLRRRPHRAASPQVAPDAIS